MTRAWPVAISALIATIAGVLGAPAWAVFAIGIIVFLGETRR